MSENPAPTGASEARRWSFGNVMFDGDEFTLYVQGRKVALELKPLEVLRYLVRRPNKAVSKDDLVKAVWPGRIISDSALTSTMAKLREALGPEGGAIRTVHGFGYRLEAEVRTGDGAAGVAAETETSRAVRRLTAIMFTDLVGYSELAHRDEPLALELLELHRGWVREILPKHGGREIETIGDAFLVEFSGALAAVECAVVIQERFASHNAAAPEGQRMQLRIGIHAGDVEHKDGKVMGDGVNIASRIHGMARPGGICVSEDVQRAVRNRPGFHLESIGSPALKNIATPLELFHLQVDPPPRQATLAAAPRRRANKVLLGVAGAAVAVIAIALAWKGSPDTPRREGVPTVAVLPFANLSADPENAFFTDGLHDTVIGQLARIKDLKVISRTSVMGYRGRQASLREIANDLDVAHIVEGSVQRTGGRLRVVVQLIDARTDAHLWSSDYDRELADVFAVQADVAREVAAAVHAQLSDQERDRIGRAPTASPAAYDLYLKAVLVEREWNNATTAQALEAVAWLDQAVALDPQFALAHALQAQMHDTLYWSGVDPLPARHALAVASADAAMKLDPGLSEARVARAFVRYHEREYEEALRELQAALELAPGNSNAYLQLVAVYRRQGRWEQALASAERAAWLDPLNPRALEYLAATQERLRRYAEADATFARSARVTSDPHRVLLRRAQNRFRWTGDLVAFDAAVQAASAWPDEACATTDVRVRLHLAQRRFQQAAELALACKEFFPESPKELWAALAYRLGGDQVRARRYGEAARAILAQSAKENPTLGTWQMRMALALAVTGDRPGALRLVGEALRAVPRSVDAVTHGEIIGEAARLYALLGEREQALSQLQQTLAIPGGDHAHELRLEPEFDSLREDPRFQKLIADHLPKPGV